MNHVSKPTDRRREEELEALMTELLEEDPGAALKIQLAFLRASERTERQPAPIYSIEAWMKA